MPITPRRKLSLPWLFWGGTTLVASLVFAYGMFGGSSGRRFFLPGETTNGHYQIELQCEACHASSFTAQAEMQAACERCHEEELRQAKDSHPKAKFTDPRNAERVARLDARLCVTCHREHVPDATLAAGLTLPEDYCVECHAEVATERPSHRDLPFDGCSAAGCHNFHDNRALYEDFLARRGGEPELLPGASIDRQRGARAPKPALTIADADGALDASGLADWARSEHGRSGVNCSDCHGREPFDTDVIIERCQGCHEPQARTWQAGKHGLRTARGLTPMRPEQARAVMQHGAGGQILSCNSCHRAHDYDARAAAVDSCLGCHADDHSRAYGGSPHAALYRDELLGSGATGSGVSCATCHMPREPMGEGVMVTEHNQNANLRPSDKMLRSVCNQCHGLSFSIDALADAELVQRNFIGKPKTHVASIDMAERRADD